MILTLTRSEKCITATELCPGTGILKFETLLHKDGSVTQSVTAQESRGRHSLLAGNLDLEDLQHPVGSRHLQVPAAVTCYCSGGKET